MKEITDMKEIQQIEMNILDYIASVCKENNLRYFLAGGSLLGAIRHKGFIPWDDDIDISMPRPDYDRLAEILKSKPDSRYRLFRIENDNDYPHAFMKVSDTYTLIQEASRQLDIKGLGLFVDIFPMDGIMDDRQEAIKLQRRSYIMAGTIGHALPNYAGFNLLQKIQRFFLVLLFGHNRRDKLDRIEARFKRYDFDKCEHVVSTFGIRGEREILNRRNFDKAIPAQFEDRQYDIPIGYDDCLKTTYGDYMQLPPEDQRYSPHSIRVFWLDRPQEESSL